MTELERQKIENEIRGQIRAEKAAYMREWKRKNKGKVSASNRRYYEQHREQILAARKAKRGDSRDRG